MIVGLARVYVVWNNDTSTRWRIEDDEIISNILNMSQVQKLP